MLHHGYRGRHWHRRHWHRHHWLAIRIVIAAAAIATVAAATTAAAVVVLAVVIVTDIAVVAVVTTTVVVVVVTCTSQAACWGDRGLKDDTGSTPVATGIGPSTDSCGYGCGTTGTSATRSGD